MKKEWVYIQAFLVAQLKIKLNDYMNHDLKGLFFIRNLRFKFKFLSFSIEMNTILSCASTMFTSPSMSLRKRCSPRQTSPKITQRPIFDSTADPINVSPLKTSQTSLKSPQSSDKRITRGTVLHFTKPSDSTSNTTRNKNNNYQVFYQFNAQHLSNRSKGNRNINPNFKLVTQITTSQSNSVFTCPFCFVDLLHPSFLMSHLQMCHFRFCIEPQQMNSNSTQSLNNMSNLIAENSSGAAATLASFHSNSASNLKQLNRKIQFNVACDEIFDGSYLGNPFDIKNAAHLGYSKSRLTPTKRCSLTYVLANK